MNATGPRPRALCPFCGRRVAIRLDSTLREHQPIDRLLEQCPGSGRRATPKAKP